MSRRLLLFKETDSGLEMVPTPEGIAEAKALLADGGSGPDGLAAMLDDPLGNGWDFVPPEAIGALTSAPIVSEDFTWNDAGELEPIAPQPCVYAHMNYQVEDPIATWARGGTVFWVKSICEPK